MKLDSIGGLFSKSWAEFRRRFVPAVEIFIAPVILILLSKLLVLRGTYPAFFFAGLLDVLSFVASILASIALITLFGHGYDFGKSYRNGFALFWASIWISILTSLAIVGGFVMLIIPGIMLAIQLTFVMYTLVLDNKRGIATLAQSRAYVEGYWWAVLGRMLLLSLVFGVIALVIFLPLNLLLGSVGGVIVYAIFLLFAAPFSTAYQYEIFSNLRRLKPHVASDAAKAETGFLKVSMALGIIGALLVFVLMIFAIVFLPSFITRQHGYPSGYPPHYSFPRANQNSSQ